MQEQTTSRPAPQDTRPRDRADTLTLALGAIAAAVVIACADTPAAAAYRATLVNLVGG